jgi:outer membrane protein assembly factor BamA
MAVRVALLLLCAACSGPTKHVVTVAAPVAANVTPVHGLATHGANIRFEGNAVASRAQLLDAMQTDDVEAGIARVLAFYYDRGYVDVRVDPPVTEGAITRLVIHEGRRFRIRKIVADEPMRSRLRARAGEWFNRRVWVDDLEAIRAPYRDAGYPLVDVRPILDVDHDHDLVDIRVSLETGPLVRVERVEVIGVPASRVHGLIDVHPGDLFDATKIEATRQRLLATGAYASVDASYGGIDPSARDARAVVRFELVTVTAW